MSAELQRTEFGLFKNENCSKETRTCSTHGDYEARNIYRDIWSDCEQCTQEQGTWYEKTHEALMEQARVERWQKTLKSSGIPERFQERDLEAFTAKTPEQQEAVLFARQYADDFLAGATPGKCVVFAGRPGTGKTHLAVGIGVKALKAKKSVLFITTIRMMRRIKETWSKDHSETETEAVKVFTFPDLLILDEVGVQFGSETEKLLFFDILNERYERKKSTIFISNLTMNEIQRYLGDRVIDRMREDGGEMIPFMWDSYRTANPIDAKNGA